MLKQNIRIPKMATKLPNVYSNPDHMEGGQSGSSGGGHNPDHLEGDITLYKISTKSDE